MTTNEMLSKIHLASVQKVAVKCAADGGARRAIEIGNDIIAYGKAWTEGFADDGRLDNMEIGKIQEGFENLVKKYVPDCDNQKLTDVLWNGFGSVLNWALGKLVGFSYKGIPYIIERWFGLVV